MKFQKGQQPWNKGKRASEEIKKKLSDSAKKRGQIPPPKKGKKDTFATILKKRASARKGPTNNKWRGGVTSLNHSVRNCSEYRQWRSDIFLRDNHCCLHCGAKSGNGVAVYLNADHFPKRFASIMVEYNIKTLQEALNCEELWNTNNGRTLCKLCHLVTHSK